MEAKNYAGVIKRQINLVVQSPPKIEIRGPSRIIISERESFQMSVTVTGVPKPVISWSRDNLEVFLFFKYKVKNCFIYLSVENIITKF